MYLQQKHSFWNHLLCSKTCLLQHNTWVKADYAQASQQNVEQSKSSQTNPRIGPRLRQGRECQIKIWTACQGSTCSIRPYLRKRDRWCQWLRRMPKGSHLTAITYVPALWQSVIQANRFFKGISVNLMLVGKHNSALADNLSFCKLGKDNSILQFHLCAPLCEKAGPWVIMPTNINYSLVYFFWLTLNCFCFPFFGCFFFFFQLLFSKIEQSNFRSVPCLFNIFFPFAKGKIIASYFYCGEKKLLLYFFSPKAGTEWINTGKPWLSGPIQKTGLI